LRAIAARNGLTRSIKQDLDSFGEFTLEVPDRRLTRGVCPVHLAPKTYDVLVAHLPRNA
jgi:hypothetical protein